MLLQARLSSQAAAEMCHGLAVACYPTSNVVVCKQVLRKLDMQMPHAAAQVPLALTC